MSFGQLIQILIDAEVEFVVIGGVAASLHGSAYLTRDLDICYSRSRSNLAKLASALVPLHPRPRDFPPGLPFVWDQATLANMTIQTLQTDFGLIDLLAEVAGVGTFDAVERQSVVMDAFGRRVSILDLRSLIAAKRAAGRPKDLMVLPELEGLLESREE